MSVCVFFFFNDTATTEIYTLSLHDALPIWRPFDAHLNERPVLRAADAEVGQFEAQHVRSEEHTSELQSQSNLVCRLLLEKKKEKAEKAEAGDIGNRAYPRHLRHAMTARIEL